MWKQPSRIHSLCPYSWAQMYPNSRRYLETTKKVVPQQALAVVTRASAIKQREEEEMTAQKEKESGAHSKTLEVEMQLPAKETVDSESESQKKVQNLEIIGNENLSDVPFQDLEDELFVPSRNRETLTRKEKRQQRAKHAVGIAPFTL